MGNLPAVEILVLVPGLGSGAGELSGTRDPGWRMGARGSKTPGTRDPPEGEKDVGQLFFLQALDVQPIVPLGARVEGVSRH